FQTSGPGPARTLTPAPLVKVLGSTDFVPAHGMAGILAACSSPTPCHIAATISVAGVRVARTGTEIVGGEEAGYVFFTLSGRGRDVLEGHGQVFRCPSAPIQRGDDLLGVGRGASDQVLGDEVPVDRLGRPRVPRCPAAAWGQRHDREGAAARREREGDVATQR